jgi:hypothetical protein
MHHDPIVGDNGYAKTRGKLNARLPLDKVHEISLIAGVHMMSVLVELAGMFRRVSIGENIKIGVAQIDVGQRLILLVQRIEPGARQPDQFVFGLFA